MKTITSLILLFFLAVVGHAQDNTFISYSYAEGFHNAQLVDMTEDERGVLWFVGLNGVLYSYDGYTFARYPLPDTLFTNNIFKVASASGLPFIYLFTDKGIIRFNGKTFDMSGVDADYPLYYGLQVVADDYQRLWYVSGSGAVRIIDRSSSHQWIAGKDYKVKWIAKKPDGTLLMVTSMNEILLVDSTMRPTLLETEISDEVLAAEFVGDSLWVVSTNGMYILDTELSLRRHFPFKVNSLKNFKVDNNNNAWILSGLKLFRFDGKNLSRVSAANGLTDNHIIQIFLDRTRTLWVNSDTDGTFKFSQKPFQKLPLPDGTVVSKILTSGDITFIGTFGSGLFVRDNNAVVSKPLAFSVFNKTLITGLIDTGNEILIGTDGQGLFSYRNGVVSAIANPGYLNLFVRTMALDGQPYIATQGGIFTYHGSRLSLVRNDIANVNAILKLNADSLLVGTQDKGLLIIAGNESRAFDDEFFSSTAVNAFARDSDGNIWAACNRNILSVYDDNLNFVRRVQLPNEVGSVTSITFSAADEVLLTADDNIYYARLTPGGLTDVKKVKRSQGFNPGELVLGGVSKQGDTLIWFSTSGGGYYLRPERLHYSSEAPIVYVSEVSLNSNADILQFATSRSGLSQLPEKLTLPYNENHLSISFQANDLQNPADIRYQYCLGGLEHSWSSYISDRKVVFANLSPGHYILKVRAVGEGGIVSFEDHFSFDVTPAFWQTVWFKLLIAGILLVVFSLMSRIISQQKLKRFQRLEKIRLAEAQRLREQMSMDFHDELGNKLAGILAYASAQRITNKDAEIEGLLTYVEQSAQAIFYGTRDFIWSIKFESNLLHEVLLYIRDFGAKFFEKHHIEFHVDADLSPVTFNATLADGYNRHIVLIFKEAMTNVVKHSGCRSVRFAASRSGDRVALAIEDDGSGMTNAAAGNGVGNIKRRAEKIGALIQYSEVSPHGTRITLTFNIV
ncbi:MAG TPA: DUF5074 domain-containing protein [Chryseosolibacter sp.]|nr:DUF5074 domain-containing protein [Chryseosolibacter sp.]